jgi:hypothetical protein
MLLPHANFLSKSAELQPVLIQIQQSAQTPSS